MLFGEILIRKLVAVDGLAPSPVMVREIPALNHKLRYDSMKPTSPIPKPLLPRAQLPKVLSSPRSNLVIESEYNSADRSFLLGDVHVYIGFFCFFLVGAHSDLSLRTCYYEDIILDIMLCSFSYYAGIHIFINTYDFIVIFIYVLGKISAQPSFAGLAGDSNAILFVSPLSINNGCSLDQHRNQYFKTK